MPSRRNGTTFACGSVLGALMLTAVMGCPQKPEPVVPKPKLGPIETPDNILAVVLLRDPEGAFEKFTTGAGAPQALVAETFKHVVTDTVPQGTRPLLGEVDLHGHLGVVVLGDLKDRAKVHTAGCVRLKNAANATKVLKASKLQGTQSTQLGEMLWSDGAGTSFAVMGNWLLVGDAPAALNDAGRWILREVGEGTPAHDVVVHLPLSRQTVGLQGEGKKALDPGTGPEATLMEPIFSSIVAAAPYLGDGELTLDFDREASSGELHVTGRDNLADWFAKFGASNPASLLSLPKAHDAIVFRVPESLSALFKPPPAPADEAPAAAAGSAAASASASPPKAPPPKSTPGAGSKPQNAKEALVALGKTFGKEVSVAWIGHRKIGGPPPPPAAPPAAPADKPEKDKAGKDKAAKAKEPAPAAAPAPTAAPEAAPTGSYRELLVRIELDDPAAAKAAMKDYFGFSGSEKKRANWNKWGADGETVTEMGSTSGMRWAIKGSYLYVDMAPDVKALSLLDAAVDPSGKGQIKEDPRSKLLADRLPKEGVAAMWFGEVDPPAAVKKDPAKKDEKKDEKKADKKDEKKEGDAAKAEPAPEKKEELKAERPEPIPGLRWGYATAMKNGLTLTWSLANTLFRDSVTDLFAPAVKEQKDKEEAAKKKAEEEKLAAEKAAEEKAKKEAEAQEKANAEAAKKEADKLKKEEEAKEKAKKDAAAALEKAKKADQDKLDKEKAAKEKADKDAAAAKAKKAAEEDAEEEQPKKKKKKKKKKVVEDEE